MLKVGPSKTRRIRQLSRNSTQRKPRRSRSVTAAEEEVAAKNWVVVRVSFLTRTHLRHRTLLARHQTIPTASTGVAEASMAAVVAAAIMAELLQAVVRKTRRYQKAWCRQSITDSKLGPSSITSTTQAITEQGWARALDRYQIRIVSEKREQKNQTETFTC